MTDAQEEKITEAQRLRCLGYYNRASALFYEIEDEHHDLAFAIKFTALLLSQGYGKKANEKITKALATSGGEEESLIAVAEILQAAVSSIATGMFSKSLSTASRIYKKFLESKLVEDYTEREISLEILYHQLRILAVGAGNTVTGPATEREKFIQLYHSCISKGLFDEARKIAEVYVGSAGLFSNWAGTAIPSERFQLLEELLKNPNTPGLTCAKTLVTLSELLLEVDDTYRSQSLVQEARLLFEREGHACGTLLIDVQRIKKPSAKMPPQERIRLLRIIKDKFEESDNMDAVVEVAMALYEIAMESTDFALSEELDREILRIKEVTGNYILWSQWQVRSFSLWGYPAGNIGRLLASLKAFHAQLEEVEMPRVRDQVTRMISEAYGKLGDHDEAYAWKTKILNKYSRVESRDEDPFVNALVATKVAPGADSEFEELKNALDRIALDASDDVAMPERYIAVLKMSQTCNCYLNQVGIRGSETTKELVKYTLERAKPLLKNLSQEHAVFCTGGFMQVEARLLLLEALLPEQPNMNLLKEACEKYQSVVQYYGKFGHTLQKASALQEVGNCRKMMWTCQGQPPHSGDFRSAVKAYEAAAKIFNNGTPSEILRLNIRFRLKLWISGYHAKVELSSWIGYEQQTPLKEAFKCLKHLEALINTQRHDLCALQTEQAILAKQALRENEDVQTLFKSAISLFAVENDVVSLWETVQKSKARSVSDLLGLGVNIPQALQSRLEKDVEVKSLFEQEQEILGRIENDKTDNEFNLRKELDAHRRTMKNKPVLREVLELREGLPVTAAKLRDLRKIQKIHGDDRQIFFADWLIQYDKLWLMVLTPDAMEFFTAGFTVKELEQWKYDHIVQDKHQEPLNDDDLSPLQELSKLIEPLVNISQEGDLLVLCASGLLHSLPIHAATISNDSTKSLIDRNPIVYCPSMTVFEQCVSRANAKTNRIGPAPQAMLAVYEKPDGRGDGWKMARDNAYEMCRELAAEMNNCKVLTGAEVDKKRFQDECEKSETLHFIGHCEIPENALKQHLVLCGGPVEPEKLQKFDINELQTQRTASNAATEVKSEIITVSDMFHTNIKTSHFNLIACASATQQIAQGDEPLGIITALLCTGATSISGTMWEVQLGTGRDFIKYMYKDFCRNDEGSVVDLAVALQKTVKRLKRSPDTREPFHWAPFVLHGSWFRKE